MAPCPVSVEPRLIMEELVFGVPCLPVVFYYFMPVQCHAVRAGYITFVHYHTPVAPKHTLTVMTQTLSSNIIPKNDAQRLEALYKYHILDTEPEDSFNNIAHIMAQVFDVPMSFISLVGKDKVFYKSQAGSFGRAHVLREDSLCSFTILSSEPLIIEDASDEACFQDNPYVAAEGGMRFYAGAPLITKDGYHIGTACIVDTKPRKFSSGDRELLVRFAKMVMYEIELRLKAIEQTLAENEIQVKNKELQDLYQELQFVTNSIPQLAWARDSEGKAIFFNERWLQYTGYTYQQMMEDAWLQVVHPDDVEPISTAWQKARATGSNYEVEYRLKRHDGVYRWFLGRGVPMHNDKGEIVKWYGTSTEIQSYKELEASLKLQARVLESMEEGVSISDANGYILYTNSAEDRLFGYTPGELIGKHVAVQNAYAEEENEQKVARVISQLKEQGCWSGEWYNRRKDGTDFYTYAHITSIQNEGKTLFVCVQHDITEEKKSKEALDYQNRLFRTVTDNATSALFLMDNNGYCTFMNNAGESMFGYSQEEIRQQPLHNLIHRHYPDGSFFPIGECPLMRAINQNEPVGAYRDLFFRKDGSALPVFCATHPVYERGVVVTTVIEVQDISLQVEAEQALRRSAAELEQMVHERTRELKQAIEQLKQFTYAASHDLQEPLRKIQFFTERLLTGLGSSVSGENQRIASRIQHTTNRMRILIDDLLHYSNAALSAEGLKEEADLNLIVRDVLDDMEAAIIEKRATIDIQELPQIRGNQRQLKQLFHNLISNALKYGKAGQAPSVGIQSRLVKREAVKGSLPDEVNSMAFYEIEVWDNGIGFEQQYAERIFGLFQRLHGRSEYEGTGVGLAIVQKVVENHKGHIRAESEPGKGASFKVLLPAE